MISPTICLWPPDKRTREAVKGDCVEGPGGEARGPANLYEALATNVTTSGFLEGE